MARGVSPASDPDADGAPNIIEYAAGTLPLAGNSTPLLTPERSAGVLRVTFPRDPGSEAILTAETSTPLSGWIASAYTVTENTPERYTVTIPLTDSRRFIRFRATLP